MREHESFRQGLFTAAYAAIAAMALQSAAAAAPSYKLTLIHKSGFSDAQGLDLNNAGDVLGCFDDCTETFRYRYKDGSLVEIRPDLFTVNGYDMNGSGDIAGTFEDPESGVFAYIGEVFEQIAPVDGFIPLIAHGINATGLVVGEGYFPNDGLGRAFIWQNGVLTIVPSGPFTSIGARVVNNAGQIAGSGSLPNSEIHFYLRSNGNIQDFGTVPDGQGGYVISLSGTGIFAGIAYMPNGAYHAVRSSNGSMIDLGTLGGSNSTPSAVNNAGHVAGQSDLANGQRRAFLFDGSTMKNLGAMGGTSSSAMDMTNNGQVCGMVTKAGGLQAAFIYGVGATGMHDLNDFISPADPLKPHVNLTSANRLNEFGQILASGVDTSINRNRLYLLTPVDSTKPVIASSVAGTQGTNGWYTSNVSLAWTVTDDEAPIASSSGCAAAAVSLDTVGKKFTCKAASIGGSATKSITVKRDSVKPAPTITRPAPGAIFNRNQSVTASFTCSDVTAGIQSCVGTIANGAKVDTSKKITNASFTVKATDKAGLTRSLTTTYSVK